ncbi:MAG: D-glycero-beta-D-manno-heptose 1-phosphate adenylyltransferase [Candidatus Omnitrophota bacterium]
MIRENVKIFTRDDLVKRVRELRESDIRVGFTNGCFDILHLGHVRYLRKASDECDILIVGVNSDRSVKALKGPDRPVNGEKARAEVLSELSCVGLLTIFDEDTPLELIKAVMPDVIFKGGDWKESEIVGADEVKRNGGRVMTISYVQGFSTTGIISRICAL